jgi:GxxExxY protein
MVATRGTDWNGNYCHESAVVAEIPQVSTWLYACTADAVLIRPNPTTSKVIACAIRVHRAIGPGLLESAYGDCLASEMRGAGLRFERGVPVPLKYKEVELGRVYVADFVVERSLLLEIKSVTRTVKVHESQILTYMRLLKVQEGLLINFNLPRLKDGLRRFLL